jgi:hypothetical protein
MEAVVLLMRRTSIPAGKPGMIDVRAFRVSKRGGNLVFNKLCLRIELQARDKITSQAVQHRHAGTRQEKSPLTGAG